MQRAKQNSVTTVCMGGGFMCHAAMHVSQAQLEVEAQKTRLPGFKVRNPLTKRMHQTSNCALMFCLLIYIYLWGLFCWFCS